MPQLIFKFSLDNTNYINALTKHYSKFQCRVLEQMEPPYSYTEPTTYFNGSDGETILGDLLPSLISQAKEDGLQEMILELRGEAADCDVLPNLITNPNEKYLNTPAQQALEKAYFNLRAQELYDMHVVDKPTFEPITQEEILNFVLTANLREEVDIQITSALNLPDSETLVFTDESGFFVYFCYGDNPKLDNVSGFYMDIEKGFRCKDKYFSSDFLGELWDHFNRWEENKYQGPLFPIEQSIGYNPNQLIGNGFYSTENTNTLFQPICDEERQQPNTTSITNNNS